MATTAARAVDVAERRARAARRHHLAPDTWASDPVELVRDLVALHSTDPASVFLSAMARSVDASPAALERALYDDRSLLRMLGMRRTMWVVPLELAAIIHAGCTKAIAARERARLVQFLEQGGVADDGARWLRHLGGRSGLLSADDAEPVVPPQPWAALLPALDPTVMGWTERSWYLGDHRAPLFDRCWGSSGVGGGGVRVAVFDADRRSGGLRGPQGS
jgi:hypothetical protein